MADRRKQGVNVQKRRWKLLLDEAWRGIVGNTAYDVVKRILAVLWLTVGSWLVSVGQRTLAAAIPALREALSTKVVITIGTITAVAIPVLILVVIWLFFTGKRQLRARENEQAVAQLSQRVAELERYNKNLLETQRANLDRLNELTRESNELRGKLREQKVFKAIYYDPNYATSWIGNPEAIADFFAQRGFQVVNAQQLGHWVDERMEHNESCRSLLVFAQDMMPDTVADLCSATCKVRLFLNKGARIVWHGDVPFWYQALPGKRYDEWMANGPQRVLAVRTILGEDLFPDRRLSGILTERGRMWGMMLPGPAQRMVPAQDVDDVFAIGLPFKTQPEAPRINLACCWRKIYNPNYPHSGFLRHWPGSRDGKDASLNADYFRCATSGWNAIPEARLPEADVLRTQTLVSSNEADKFRRVNSDDPWKLAAFVGEYWSWIQIPDAHWIWWRHWVTPEFQTGGAVEHRREFELEKKPRQVTLMLAVDDMARNLQVNGVSLGDKVGVWDRVTIVDLTPHVRQGGNLLEMTVVNASGPSPASPDDNPTGLCYRIDVVY